MERQQLMSNHIFAIRDVLREGDCEGAVVCLEIFLKPCPCLCVESILRNLEESGFWLPNVKLRAWFAATPCEIGHLRAKVGFRPSCPFDGHLLMKRRISKCLKDVPLLLNGILQLDCTMVV